MTQKTVVQSIESVYRCDVCEEYLTLLRVVDGGSAFIAVCSDPQCAALHRIEF